MTNYNCKHFTTSLAEDEDKSNISLLLNHVAKAISEANITSENLLDIVFHDENDIDGTPWPSVSVYYEEND